MEWETCDIISIKTNIPIHFFFWWKSNTQISLENELHILTHAMTSVHGNLPIINNLLSLAPGFILFIKIMWN